MIASSASFARRAQHFNTTPSHHQVFRLRQNFLRRHSPVHAGTYVENVAGQVRPLVSERLPAAVLTFRSLRDAVCWSSRPPEETTCKSSCGLRRGDNCCCCAHRLVDWAATVIDLGLGFPSYETGRSFVPCSPRTR